MSIADPAGAVVPAIGPWQDATVTEVRDETPRVKTFSLSLRHPTGHAAGQHYLVRLTAPDGYRAQRSYSVASPPGDAGRIELTVERLDDGEVSTYLHDEVVVGDELEVRGPVGGWFVWDGTQPALLVGGGSGVVPLISMLRLARRTADAPPVHLIVSTRDRRELIYADELAGPDVTVVYSRAAAPNAARPAGRITTDDLMPLVRSDQTAYVCGSARFARAASTLLMEVGVAAERIRVERFGPTS